MSWWLAHCLLCYLHFLIKEDNATLPMEPMLQDILSCSPESVPPRQPTEMVVQGVRKPAVTAPFMATVSKPAACCTGIHAALIIFSAKEYSCMLPAYYFMQDWMAGFPHGAGHYVPRARKRRRSFIVGVHVGRQGQRQSVNDLCMLHQVPVSVSSV